MSGMNQYLTFSLGDEIFALDIASVREVLELATVTRIPKTPQHMRGVINLRGNAVPVVEMRTKFGMEAIQDTVDTCIIIVDVVIDGTTTIIGTLVDSVREVIDIEDDAIEPAPQMGTAIKGEFIRGIGKVNDQFVIILDVEKVFSMEELAALTVA